MIYDVDINGRTRRVAIQRQGPSYIVSLDGSAQAADVTYSNGMYSLVLSDAGPDGATTSRRESHEVAVVERPGGEMTIHVNGRLVPLTVCSGRRASARFEGAEDAGDPGPRKVTEPITVSGGRRASARRGEAEAASGPGPHKVTAPMPGKVVKLLVARGDTVSARQGVVIVEAMKMENELRTPKAGTVTDVKVTEGTSVEAGAVLIIVE